MKILEINYKNFNEIVKKAAKYIKEGKVIVCPTDTVYGLIAGATNKKAVNKLFKIKKRKVQKPIPIFVKDIKTAKKLAKVNKTQEEILKEIWPGKVTVVLKRPRTRTSSVRGKKPVKMTLYGVDKKTIAFRIPRYKLVDELLKKLNFPLTGTSANISRKPATTKIKEILKQFESQKFKPDLIIDAGDLKSSKASTIIDLTGPKPKILRK